MKKKRIPIGKFLISRGYLSIEEEREIAAEQQKLGKDNYEAFGRIAVRKGFCSEKIIKEAMRARSSMEKGS